MTLNFGFHKCIYIDILVTQRQDSCHVPGFPLGLYLTMHQNHLEISFK